MVDPTFQPKIYKTDGGDTLVVAPGGKVLMPFLLHVDIADLSADAAYHVVSPWAADIAAIHSVINGAVGTADVTVTASTGGVNVTNGALTIATAASAAGDIDSAAPTALNSVAAGAAIKLTVAGGGAGGSPSGHVVLVMNRTA